ncbi:MAG: hypothetical protein JOZ22_12860, partial [Acidobacteriia bacterium]|nr:hypothetical protein [Terriglobia bacterium]
MKYLVVLVAMATVVGLAAQTGGESPFVGTWKLNVEKSKFDPGPANQSETVTIGADNKVTVDGVSAGGNH